MSIFSSRATNISPIPEKITQLQLNITVAESGRLEDGTVTLGATCISDSEIDYEIDGLIKSLEKVRRAAKEKISRK